eukprot:scaffold133765_cov60-Attheya_sp.AAC.5
MPPNSPQRKYTDTTSQPSTPSSRVETRSSHRQQLANQESFIESIQEKESASTTDPSTDTSSTMTAATEAAAAAAAHAAAYPPTPTSSHQGAIIETTRVGIALRDQAQEALTLDTKFDAKPKNLKGFLRELNERAMDCCWEAHNILTFANAGGINMSLLVDYGKISTTTIEAAAVAARLNVSDAGLRRTQRSKHLYKCLSKSISTSIRDNLDPYLKTIHQDGPLYFKYLMLEVASNPSSEAEARDIRQTLSRLQLAKQMKTVSNNVKAFNLHVHSQLVKLASYTTDQKEDLDTNLMATYRSIPCSAFRSELRSLDRDRRTNQWSVKEVLTQVLVKYNDVRTNEEWIMDLKDQDPPTNPIAMAAIGKQSHTKGKGTGADSKTGMKTKDRDKNWKYAPPKAGEAEIKTISGKEGTKEKRFWCGHEQCKRWTLSHNTEGHVQKGPSDKGHGPPKAKDMKLQSSLKTFLAANGNAKKKLSKKECQKLQALLSTMHHSKDSDDAGSVDSE